MQMGAYPPGVTDAMIDYYFGDDGACCAMCEYYWSDGTCTKKEIRAEIDYANGMLGEMDIDEYNDLISTDAENWCDDFEWKDDQPDYDE